MRLIKIELNLPFRFNTINKSRYKIIIIVYKELRAMQLYIKHNKTFPLSPCPAHLFLQILWANFEGIQLIIICKVNLQGLILPFQNIQALIWFLISLALGVFHFHYMFAPNVTADFSCKFFSFYDAAGFLCLF